MKKDVWECSECDKPEKEWLDSRRVDPFRRVPSVECFSLSNEQFSTRNFRVDRTGRIQLKLSVCLSLGSTRWNASFRLILKILLVWVPCSQILAGSERKRQKSVEIWQCSKEEENTTRAKKNKINWISYGADVRICSNTLGLSFLSRQWREENSRGV